MKFITKFLLIFPFIVFAHELKVIKNYHLAAQKEIWQNNKRDYIPDLLIENVLPLTVPHILNNQFNPYYTQDNYVLCIKSCDHLGRASKNDIIEAENIYYWLDQFFHMLSSRFNISIGNQLKVYTNRNIRNPEDMKRMRDNAFFNPEDNSLSFLPASKVFLASVFGRDRLNRTGFDASVIAHEAGHALFNILLPNALNKEVDGFNEGFADYMANIFLDNPKLGLIMLKGRALRDSSSLFDSEGKLKQYKVQLGEHDLGERFATGLWLVREKVSDKLAYDQLIFNTVQDWKEHYVLTAHDIKKYILAALRSHLDKETYLYAERLWETVINGDLKEINDTSFLNSKNTHNNFIGLRIKTTFPDSLKNQFGIEDQDINFSILRTQDTQDNYQANLVSLDKEKYMTPFWFLIDKERKNILKVWRFDGSNIDSSDIEQVKKLTDIIQDTDSHTQGFYEQAELFKQIIKNSGEAAMAYKVKNIKTKNITILINGKIRSAQEYSFNFNRKTLGFLAGAPKLRNVKMITIIKDDTLPENWPEIDDQYIVSMTLGYGAKDTITQEKTLTNILIQ